jgi:ribosomal protein L40E
VNLTNPTFTSNSPSFPSLEAVGAVGLIILVAAGLLAYRRVRSSRTLPEKAAAAESSPPQVAKGVNKSGNADMFCSQCGARIPCNSKFCKECGTNLT